MTGASAGHRVDRRGMARALTRLVAAGLLIAGLGCGGDSDGPDDDGGGPGPDSRVVWTYDAGPAVYYGSPALSPDESTVYFGTSLWLTATPSREHALVALNSASGALRWRWELGGAEVRSTPAVGDDGSIYVVLTGRSPTPDSLAADVLCRLTPAGALAWSLDINPARLTTEIGQAAPAIGADGTIYVGGDRLYAVRPDGTIRWTAFDLSWESRRNAPVIGADGTVYFCFHNIPLTALDPETGAIRWQVSGVSQDHCFASPAIGADGTIYVGIQPGIVYAVAPDGQLRWQFDIASAGFSGFLRSSPAVAADGTIYFGLNFGNPSSALFALTPAGAVKWIFEPSDLPGDTPRDHFDIYSSPAIGSDGTIYFGQEFGRVYALNPDGTLRWIEPTRSGVTWPSPALAADGTLFIADISGRCFAIRTDSRGLQAGAPWPKFRGGNQNRGRGPATGP